MRPDANDPPAKLPQTFPDCVISVSVSEKFCIPVFEVGKRTPVATGTAVPEAAVHKYNDSPFTKNKVRLSD